MKTLLLILCLFATPWEDQLRRERPASKTTAQTRRTADEAKYGVQNKDSDYLKQRRGETLPANDGFAAPTEITGSGINDFGPVKQNWGQIRILRNRDGKVVGKIIEYERSIFWYDARGKLIQHQFKMQW
jgi:hypothetical protein